MSYFTDFDKIRSMVETYDHQREAVVGKGREVISLSKKVIYAMHRNELDAAKSASEEMKTAYTEMHELCKANPKLEFEGAFKAAAQEYVEALVYLGFVTKEMPSMQELNVYHDYYLLGVADVAGELVRRAVNAGLAENYEQVYEVKSFMDDLYNELMLFDFRNGELRKKTDATRWELKKIDEMVLNLKLRKL